MSSSAERTRRGEVPSVYIKNDADYWRNDRERQRLKLRMRTAKNNATATALRRRDEAAARWRGRRMVWDLPGADQGSIAAAIRFCERGGES